MFTAPVNKILPLSVVDGPGNRVSIFFQGCNIHCAYCHNPETQKICIACGECVKGCPESALSVKAGQIHWNKAKCVQCDQCITICRHFASPRVVMMNTEQVFYEIKKSIPFIRGITVSGGECMLYPEFLTELFHIVKQQSLTCLIDSNGMVDFSKYPILVELCDGVMLDVKSWDSSVYTALTDFDNQIVKQNLAYLSERNKLAEVRIVCLEGEVDSKATIDGIAQTVGFPSVQNLLLKLIKFRKFGVKGRLSDFPAPDMKYMSELADYATKRGFCKVLIV